MKFGLTVESNARMVQSRDLLQEFRIESSPPGGVRVFAQSADIVFARARQTGGQKRRNPTELAGDLLPLDDRFDLGNGGKSGVPHRLGPCLSEGADQLRKGEIRD